MLGEWTAEVARARADIETARDLVLAVCRPQDASNASTEDEQRILDARRLTATASQALDRAWKALRS
jgi:hypothetical protein